MFYEFRCICAAKIEHCAHDHNGHKDTDVPEEICRHTRTRSPRTQSKHRYYGSWTTENRECKGIEHFLRKSDHVSLLTPSGCGVFDARTGYLVALMKDSPADCSDYSSAGNLDNRDRDAEECQDR